ncbi:dehydrogenase [Burkholderia pseudomallei]|nr:dehydrogenase [Burkholderia pseudomallei]
MQAELTKKELTLCASRLNCAMFPQVIEWIADGRVHPEHIVTHTLDFRDVARAFELAERNPRESCKILLDFAAH